VAAHRPTNLARVHKPPRVLLRNHRAADSLNYFAYNFVQINRSLRMSPAMAAGVTPKALGVSDIVALLKAAESKERHRRCLW
jgi:hypothetical protein